MAALHIATFALPSGALRWSHREHDILYHDQLCTNNRRGRKP
jgi:hypothetical protein